MTKPKPLPPVEVLNELLEYDPDTGLLRWKVSRGCDREGKVAGWKDDEGYIRVEIYRKVYKTHRIIWKMIYGEDPEVNKVIDHINQVKDDNRLCNLRLVSILENNLNGGAGKPGATGIKYLSWQKDKKAYRVVVKRKHIGYSKTLDGAMEMLNQYMRTIT
jgi:hypothetical protein